MGARSKARKRALDVLFEADQRGIDPVRLLADMAVYAVLMLVTRVIRPSDIKDVLRMIKDRKKIQAEAAGG